jgi:predicted nuclease of predicted toxin-antitoxin system
MRLVADESVDGPIVERLRADGHEVLYVAELDPGASDEVILEQARTAACLLVTSDKDFGELIFRLKKLPGGVILLRLAGVTNLRKAEIVASAMQDYGDSMIEAFTVVTPGNVRIRQRIELPPREL